MLDTMVKEKPKLFTVPVTLTELIEFHVAASIKGNRNATALAYQFIRNQIREAKEQDAEGFEKLFPLEEKRILDRSKRKKKERRVMHNGGQVQTENKKRGAA
jgi:hypothetical protein